MHRDDERIVFLDYERHEHLVGISAHFDEAVFYRYDDAVATVAGAIRERGWAGGSVGIERWTQSPGAPLVDEVAEAIAATGARVVDGDWTVDRVRLVKSPAELERVRRAGGDRRRRLRGAARRGPPGHDRAADRIRGWTG